MSKDDTGGGLLSKVVKFVRSPGSGWTDAEQDSSHESSYSKQMLKEMIERKRRNDFVRKREFDMLRKMRRSEVMAGQDPAARPSFFQSSLPSKPDDRATTLKKIDEIEAQMSMQWWKTKHGNSQIPSTGAHGSGFPMSAHVPPEQMRPAAAPAATSYSRTAPQALPVDGGAPAPAPSLMDAAVPEGTTQALGLVPQQQQPAHAPGQRPAAANAGQAIPTAREIAAQGAPSVPNTAPSTFSPSKQFAIQVEEFAH